MKIEPSARVKNLPPYIFAELDKAKREALERGADVIALSVGDPDVEPPRSAIEAMKAALDDKENHKYPAYVGHKRLREATSDYFLRRFGVRFDPEDETIILIGSKEGLAHLQMAYLDPGDVELVPDPCFPMYLTSAMFAGARTVRFPLLPERGFLPDFSTIPSEDAKRAKVILTNYPNNPTGASASPAFYRELVAFAREYDLLIVQDAAYAEMYFSDEKPASVFEAEGARERAIEIHSFSKTFSAAGWRLGFAVGNAELIRPLARVKDQIDSGAFDAVQLGAVRALQNAEDELARIREEYGRRRAAAAKALTEAGIDFFDGHAALYLWAKTPSGSGSMEFCRRLLAEEAVVVTPGAGFGAGGEGYYRIALCSDERRVEEGIARLARFVKRLGA